MCIIRKRVYMRRLGFDHTLSQQSRRAMPPLRHKQSQFVGVKTLRPGDGTTVTALPFKESMI